MARLLPLVLAKPGLKTTTTCPGPATAERPHDGKAPHMQTTKITYELPQTRCMLPYTASRFAIGCCEAITLASGSQRISAREEEEGPVASRSQIPYSENAIITPPLVRSMHHRGGGAGVGARALQNPRLWISRPQLLPMGPKHKM